MNKRMLSAKQVKDLLANDNVSKCSSKMISFNPQFKVWAVKRYTEGFSPGEIFKEAGFNLGLIGRDTAKDRLKDWRRTVKRIGWAGLAEERRGRAVGPNKGRPRVKGLTDSDKIKRLEAQVAYLKAENDFLAKLRSGKTE